MDVDVDRTLPAGVRKAIRNSTSILKRTQLGLSAGPYKAPSNKLDPLNLDRTLPVGVTQAIKDSATAFVGAPLPKPYVGITSLDWPAPKIDFKHLFAGVKTDVNPAPTDVVGLSAPMWAAAAPKARPAPSINDYNFTARPTLFEFKPEQFVDHKEGRAHAATLPDVPHAVGNKHEREGYLKPSAGAMHEYAFGGDNVDLDRTLPAAVLDEINGSADNGNDL
jgi:hypothetical protein